RRLGIDQLRDMPAIIEANRFGNPVLGKSKDWSRDVRAKLVLGDPAEIATVLGIIFAPRNGGKISSWRLQLALDLIETLLRVGFVTTGGQRDENLLQLELTWNDEGCAVRIVGLLQVLVAREVLRRR